jgi:Domain of unknown function (DUF4157)
MSELTHALRTPDADSKLRIQRKCGCGGSCGSCSEEEKKKKVQRRALGDVGSEIPRSVQSVLGSGGRPLDAETRATMESRFGRSFAEVRVHTDSHAAASAHDISAAAYTAGTHIVFGAGRFEPDTAQGRRLLAHELAHVAQQTSGASSISHGIGPADDVHERAADRVADAVVAQGPAFAPPPAIVPVAERLVRRKWEESEPAVEVEPRFIVDDEMTPAPGQMRRQEFVEELDAVVCATSNREMAALGQSTDNCPLLARWRPRIRAMDSRQLEISMRRWVGGDASVRNAHDYIPRVAARLAESIRIWGATGDVSGVPPDLMDLMGGGTIRIGVGSLIRGAVGKLFRKARDGAAAPAPTVSGALVALDAEGGRPLDHGIASRMGGAFGRDFSNVRIHTDADAATAATSMNARAFTVGHDIAFAGGEYAPGTIIGDALLAHELAHVVQQDGAAEVLTKSEAATGALEHDADDAAVHAVTSLWPGLRRFTRDMRSNAMPRLKSSLKLQRCDASSKELQEYLRVLDATKAIEDHGDSDDKARQIAEAWSKGDTQYILTARRKKLLIEEMLDGDVSRGDQEQILNLLERSWAVDLKRMIGPGGVPHQTLLNRFGSWKTELWRFYMRRYTDAYPDDVAHDVLFADEAPPAQAPPSPAKLDATEPSDDPRRMVQFGDPLPETTQSTSVSTKRSMRTLDREQAAAWVTAQYGTLISKERSGLVGKTRVTRMDKSDFFVSFVSVCMNERLEKLSTRKERDEKRASIQQACEAEESITGAFHDPSDQSITVHDERETPETMVHELLHVLSDDRVHELGRFATEGLTELLTRLVILRHKYKSGEAPLYVGGHYGDAYDALQELAITAGEDLLARVHFQGAVTELCNKLGKAKFDAWNAAMEDRDNGVAATAILHRKFPDPKPEDPKCT